MTEPVAVLVTAAGRGERFGSKKETTLLAGRTVLDRAVSAFLRLPGLAALVVTAPPGEEEEARSALGPETRAFLEDRLPGRFAIAAGGPTRRDSVRLGLEALARMLPAGASAPGSTDTVVLVHDGARPWASPALAEKVADLAARSGACVPVTPLVETPKELDPAGLVKAHPRRSSLGAAQTPQGFLLSALLDAHRRADSEGVDCTDDSELWARYVGPVAWTEGERANRKITYREDMAPLHADSTDLEGASEGPQAAAPAIVGAGAPPYRIGEGWDLHRLVSGRKLVLGGVEVPSDRGEDGYSDGDVLFHAVIDALLGAAALGDIGTHFPPGDAAWKDADSRDLTRRALALVRGSGWEPINLDCTVMLERPRLAPYREAIRAGLADALGMDLDTVSVKAKTREGVDAVGEGRAVEARAVILAARIPREGPQGARG